MTPTSSPTADADASLLGGYQPPGRVFDELVTEAGALHPHWGCFAQRFSTLGQAAVEQRWAAGQRLIQDNGVTYNVYGDPRGQDRQWVLDPLPLLIDQHEWARIEAAVLQRARLLNLVLGDIYGPQRLLHESLLPPELIYANPNFLRPVHDIRPRGDRHLISYAVDVARNPDGKWWVINDRTQAPSGSGYALENRIVVSRILPDLFRDCGVRRLALFFARLRETLMSLAPDGGENPRVVLLTPGPYNETYFEHAYLARYLGITLVEGSDLTVRDNRVYLKTLGGLQRVDVILRRVDDGYCDPLELRQDSVLGVPGLVHAAASGQVTIANALGSGVVETAAITPFLPGLCQALLGEELQLPSVAVWWCGQPQERQYVLENLEKLIVKPAFPGMRMEPVFGDQLDKKGRAELAAKIKALPHRYVAQESVALSTAPVWAGGQVVPRHIMLRFFVAAHADGYTIMPGGLCRVSGSHDSLIVSMQRGGGSKDVWVLTDQPVSRISLLNRDFEPTAEVTRAGLDLPSRVADSMFWLGRYIERSEGLVRLMRAIVSRMTEETSPNGCPELPALIVAMDQFTDAGGEDGPIAEPFADVGRTSRHLLRAMFDGEYAGSLIGTVSHARRLGSIVRDRISLDTWRILAQLERAIEDEPGSAHDLTLAMDLLDRLVTLLAAVQGHASESMTRGLGWRFLEMGRRIERAMATATLLRSLAVEPAEDERPVLDALLEICVSRITYRARYRSGIGARGVIDLLLQDESNPRSVAYQFAALDEHVAALAPHAEIAQRTAEQRLVLAIRSSVQLADPTALREATAGRREALDALLDRVLHDLPELSDRLTQSYLTHAQPSRQLGRLREPPRSDGP